MVDFSASRLRRAARSPGRKRFIPSMSRAPAIMYATEARAMEWPKPRYRLRSPIAIGAVPPPSIQPVQFIRPLVVPRAAGRTTSKIDAKIFASYIPFRNPQQIRAAIVRGNELDNPQRITNGTPAKTPIAWVIMRPRTVFSESLSARYPPKKAPHMLPA